MRYGRLVSLLSGPPQPPAAARVLMELAVLLFAASHAHALPSRRSGLGGGSSGGGGGGGFNYGVAATGGDRGLLHSEHEHPLPPPPSHKLVADMYRHNAAFDYHYAFWNVTELDAEGCHQLAELANDETSRSTDPATSSCIPNYSCDFERLRYPHWLVYTSCTKGGGACQDDPEAPQSLVRCGAHEEDILMLRYIHVASRTTTERSVGGPDDEAEPTDITVEKPADEDKDGEWQLWFFQVPSFCNCFL